jgi:hypothetical protein
LKADYTGAQNNRVKAQAAAWQGAGHKGAFFGVRAEDGHLPGVQAEFFHDFQGHDDIDGRAFHHDSRWRHGLGSLLDRRAQRLPAPEGKIVFTATRADFSDSLSCFESTQIESP